MKKLLPILLLTIFVTPANATIKQGGTGPRAESKHNVVYIMNAKTTTGAGDPVTVYPGLRTFHATVAGTGAVTATVIIQVSNDAITWIDATTAPHIALSGTTSASDGFSMDAKWAYIRANVDAISGTGAAVTVKMGI
jgi:hypothetical protein